MKNLVLLHFFSLDKYCFEEISHWFYLWRLDEYSIFQLLFGFYLCLLVRIFILFGIDFVLILRAIILGIVNLVLLWNLVFRIGSTVLYVWEFVNSGKRWKQPVEGNYFVEVFILPSVDLRINVLWTFRN